MFQAQTSPIPLKSIPLHFSSCLSNNKWKKQINGNINDEWIKQAKESQMTILCKPGRHFWSMSDMSAPLSVWAGGSPQGEEPVMRSQSPYRVRWGRDILCIWKPNTLIRDVHCRWHAVQIADHVPGQQNRKDGYTQYEEETALRVTTYARLLPAREGASNTKREKNQMNPAVLD